MKYLIEIQCSDRRKEIIYYFMYCSLCYLNIDIYK